MNLLTLRHDLAKQLQVICKDFVLKKPMSDECCNWVESGLTIFEQQELSPRMDTEFSHHPFIVVKATGGSVSSENTELGNITLVIATWDGGTRDEDEACMDDLSGEDDLLNIIERIKNYFLAYPILSKKFSCQKDISYELVEDQPKPYWYATLTMTWELPKTNLMTGADYV